MYEILKNVYICNAYFNHSVKRRVRIIEKSGENRLDEPLATCCQKQGAKT